MKCSANALHSMKRLEAAKRIYSEAIICDPLNEDISVEYSYLLHDLEQYNETVNHALRSPFLYTNAKLRFILAKSYFQLKNFHSALHWLESMLSAGSSMASSPLSSSSTLLSTTTTSRTFSTFTVGNLSMEILLIHI